VTCRAPASSLVAGDNGSSVRTRTAVLAHLQIEDENIFTDEITDDALEAAASGPSVTFTLSMVLFACQFLSH
jgi:hypothetical protein